MNWDVLHRDILISSIAGTLARRYGAVAMAFWFGGRRDDREGNGFEALAMLILGRLRP